MDTSSRTLIGVDSVEIDQPIREDSMVDARRHICAFYNSPRDQYCVLLPFIKDGFDRGEKAVICSYDLARFRGDVVVEVMRTHPIIIVRGILKENPFFVPPDQFLRELRERRERSGTTAVKGEP